MKHEKRPTLKQKKLILSKGLILNNWHVLRDYFEVIDGKKVNILYIIHIHSLKPRKIIY